MGGIGLEHALTKPHVSIRITLRVRDSRDPTLQVRKRGTQQRSPFSRLLGKWEVELGWETWVA